jgi:ectoine hydroxylase-related dioxygenase (phytanoyl-CoA dioxygenase family)
MSLAEPAAAIDLAAAKAQLQREGFAIVPGVLDAARCEDVRGRLWRAAEESERRGAPTRNIGIDPNEHNVRVFNLIDLDPVFIELIQHPLGIELVASLLGPGFLISNFTANIALPGARSMKPHSDQSIVVPEPWLQPWSINIIWCLTDVTADNGATRYLPMSHRIAWTKDVPEDPRAGMRPFEASAGSIIAMDGRLWHTSGANITSHDERALLFGYYSRDFVRPQTNWNATLSPATIATLSPQMHAWLGLGPTANINLAGPLSALRGKDA